MIVGVPKEIKVHEYRVGLTPGSAREHSRCGHKVLIETGAGADIGADDQAFIAAGAQIAESAEAVFAEADMIVKVKEPLAREWPLAFESRVQ
jgi:alanine dehydrogenase